jgi:hypothetical protein
MGSLSDMFFVPTLTETVPFVAGTLLPAEAVNEVPTSKSAATPIPVAAQRLR